EPALEYNSANYRAQWQTLQRVVKGPRAVKFPQLTRLFTGSKAEQKEAVKLFVESGNLADAEATFTATQRYREKTRKNRALLTIKQMREKGFSESLAFVLQAFLIGMKIRGCVSRGGIADEDAPLDPESTRYWATVGADAAEEDETEYESRTAVAVDARDAMAAIGQRSA
ncbi:Uncharacterized protein SCF082_LOCUS25088, partial [Durusdinium trenchii]